MRGVAQATKCSFSARYPVADRRRGRIDAYVFGYAELIGQTSRTPGFALYFSLVVLVPVEKKKPTPRREPTPLPHNVKSWIYYIFLSVTSTKCAAEKKANPASRTNPSTPQREMLDMLSPKRTHKIPNRFINSPGNFPSALNSPGSLSPGGGADAEQTSKELTTPAKKPSPQHRGTEVGSQAMAAARIQKSASAVPFFNKSAIGQPPVAVQPVTANPTHPILSG
eukprot:g6156.t1